MGDTPTMEPIGVHHVAVNVTDVEAAVALYTGVLGGRVRDDRPDLGIAGAWIDLGAAQVHLVELPVPPSMGQHSRCGSTISTPWWPNCVQADTTWPTRRRSVPVSRRF